MYQNSEQRLKKTYCKRRQPTNHPLAILISNCIQSFSEYCVPASILSSAKALYVITIFSVQTENPTIEILVSWTALILRAARFTFCVQTTNCILLYFAGCSLADTSNMNRFACVLRFFTHADIYVRWAGIVQHCNWIYMSRKDIVLCVVCEFVIEVHFKPLAYSIYFA